MNPKKYLVFIFFLLFLSTNAFANFNYSTEFNSLDKNFFLVYDHGGYDQSPTTKDYNLVKIENGILKMPVSKTDHGPELITKGIKITSNSTITVEWKVKVHYANEYFRGSVTFWLFPEESFYDSTKGDTIRPFQYWDAAQNKASNFSLATVRYSNYFYGNGEPPIYGNSFGICGYKKCLTSTPIWDSWVTNKVEIDIPNKTIKFWQNGQYVGEVPVNPNIDLEETPYLKIHFSPYGWYTGHEMDLDWLKINISSSNTSDTSNPPTSSDNCYGSATFDFLTMTLNIPSMKLNNKFYKLKLKLVKSSPVTFELTGITELKNEQPPQTSITKKVILSTMDKYEISFVRNQLGDSKNYFDDYDISLEPWCTEKPGLCGNFIDLGNVDINDNIQIPSSGYLSDKAGFEDCVEIDPTHTFINKNRDGSYTIFKILKHEKPDECDHKIEIEYKNLK